MSANKDDSGFIEYVKSVYPEIDIQIVPYRGANTTQYMFDQLYTGHMSDIYSTTQMFTCYDKYPEHLIDLSKYGFTSKYKYELEALAPSSKRRAIRSPTAPPACRASASSTCATSRTPRSCAPSRASSGSAISSRATPPPLLYAGWENIMVDLGNAFFAYLRGECTAADVMAFMDARQTENLSDGGHIVLSVTELPNRRWQYSNFRFVVQGTDLGMAITKRLVKLMGGQVSLKTQKGKGSVFTIDLELRLPDATDNVSFYRHDRQCLLGGHSHGSAPGARAGIAPGSCLRRMGTAEILQLYLWSVDVIHICEYNCIGRFRCSCTDNRKYAKRLAAPC